MMLDRLIKGHADGTGGQQMPPDVAGSMKLLT
jgi:hypothetical protein